MRNRSVFFLLCIAGVVFLPAREAFPADHKEAPASGHVVIELGREPGDAVSALHFGQFLERFGAHVKPGDEQGPQSAVQPGAHLQLRPDVAEKLLALKPGIIRFPGGYAVEGEYDWSVLIDRSPWRSGPREPGREFGYEEFFALCREAQAEPLVVVNFRHAVWGALPGEVPASAEDLAAGLVAYCNLPEGSKLPSGMPDWPAIRAANGSPAPHGVRYFQIGNEWVAWLKGTAKVREKIGLTPFPDEATFHAHVKSRLLSVIRAMRAIDPSIRIIIDGVFWDNSQEPLFRMLLSDEEVRAAADLAAVHIYHPWGVKDAEFEGKKMPVTDVPEDDLWMASVSTPQPDADGQTRLGGAPWKLARSLGWKVALTEWNWNGWGLERPGACLWARGLGAAGFLHAILREAGSVELATQSMMVGNHWHIAGVRVEGDRSRIVPTAAMTAFYRTHAGTHTLPIHISNNKLRERRVATGSITGGGRVAMVDAIATKDGDRIILHVIHRDRHQPFSLEIQPGPHALPSQARVITLTGSPLTKESESPFMESARHQASESRVNKQSDGKFLINLPPASVSAIILTEVGGMTKSE